MTGADEYIIEDPVPLRGPVQEAVFRFLLGPLIVGVTIFICIWMPKAFSHFTTNPALAEEPVYRAIGYVYIPLIILFVCLCTYYFLSIYREKVMLTSKAILRRNVFSTDRIAFADMLSVEAEYETFNFNQKSRVTSFILGLLLGINWQVHIQATGSRGLTIRNMTQLRAGELKARLDAARGMNTTTL